MQIIHFYTPSCFFVNTSLFYNEKNYLVLLDCTGSCMVECPSTMGSAKKICTSFVSRIIEMGVAGGEGVCYEKNNKLWTRLGGPFELEDYAL